MALSRPSRQYREIFRHLDAEALDADYVDVFQVFTGYYDLADGGVSSKRRNAQFVGRVAAKALDSFTYHSIEFDLDPPKRGAERPTGWQALADDTAERIATRL